jgi:hypothetical protein
MNVTLFAQWVGVNSHVGVNKKRPILTPFHPTSIFQDMEFPQKHGNSIFLGGSAIVASLVTGRAHERP